MFGMQEGNFSEYSLQNKSISGSPA